MATQYSTTARTNRATQLNTDIGTSAKINIYTGAAPANVGTAASGTLIVTLVGNATSFGTASAGALTGYGTTTASAASTGNPIGPVNAANTGTAGYFRIATSGSTDVVQGLVFQSVALTTSALTAANGNVLTFTATTGVSVGMNVAGTGVLAGTTVVAVSGTTVTMSLTSTAGVANAASITFNGDLTLANTSINATQAVSVTSLVLTMSGA
jgi:fibronectin-binding autotransporter adhesin